MLERLFVKIIDMSTNAALLILLVLLCRLFLKRMPKIFSYSLWGAVLFRLLFPFDIALPFGLVPKVQSVVSGYTYSEYFTDYATVEKLADKAIDNAVNGDFEPQTVPVLDLSEKYAGHVVYEWWEPIVYYSRYLWLVGCGIMVLIGLVGYWKLKKRIRGAECIRDNIYVSDTIGSPFVMKLRHPRIYLPSGLTEREQEYILLHEAHHISRYDHIWKALSFIALCLHWFNPLVWIAFCLSARDMEMSCDEAVLKKLNWENRADYSALLLRFTIGRTTISGAPLAFGEGDTKKRILNISNWKEQAKKILVVVSAVCGVLLVGLSFTHRGGNYGVGVKKIFDTYPYAFFNQPEIEFKMLEFPGVRFVCGERGLIAYEGDKETQIFSRLANLYLADLNGDLRRELCGTMYVGSGIVDCRVVVYDYADGMGYNLQERGDYDYFLSGGYGGMVVNRAEFGERTACLQGRLGLFGRKLTFSGGLNVVSGERTTPFVNMDMLEKTYRSSRGTVNSYIPGYNDSGTSTGRNRAVEYYIAANESILGGTVDWANSHVSVKHKDMQWNKDVYQYLFFVGEFAWSGYEPYVYYSNASPEQFFVCTEYRDKGCESIEEYYNKVITGEIKPHKETYIIRLDEYGVYRWGSDENLYS